MDAIGWTLLVGGGFAAGAINTMAGGGSMLTVPLLVFLGLPPLQANATNRLGILASSITSAWGFQSENVSGFRGAIPVVLPVLVGGFAGAAMASQLSDAIFRQLFGVVMIVLLIPTLRTPGFLGARPAPSRPWSRATTFLVFLAIGFYGGAIQAGVGIFLIYALTHAGYDLVRANSIKVVVAGSFTAVALPVFIAAGQVDWALGGALAAGFAGGGLVGARWTVAGGERLVRPVLAIAVVALAGRMLGLY